MKTWLRVLIALGVAAVAVSLLFRYGRPAWYPLYRSIRGERTVEQTVDGLRADAEGRLRPHFDRAGVAWPPERVALLVFKRERVLELWAEQAARRVRVRDYPILAASGRAGPKLAEGDRQVPEGVYRIVALNPNSAYHLSMKLDYPNEYDLARARDDGRIRLGGDIFIHGGDRSIGCIALGDDAIEELFLLAGRVGCRNVRVVIAPNDLRAGQPAATHPSNPAWTPALHEDIRRELASFTR